MKIYLSAIETAIDHSTAAVAARVPHVLTSFYYCSWKAGLGRRRPMWETCLRQAKLRLADSGAHTFRTAGFGLGGAAQGVLGTDYDEFLDAYMTWIRATARSRLIDFWVELDIGVVAGTKWVNAHRDRMIGGGLGYGLVQVWHSDEHDWDYWVWLLKEAKRPGRSNYVAIEGHSNSVRSQHDYAKFLHEAYRRGVRVHAFKITDHEGLKKWPFFSVDSTSWIAPSRYGCRTLKVRSGGVVLTRSSSVARGEQSEAWRAPIGRTTTVEERIPLLIRSAQTWVQAERELNALWLSRGVDWDKAIASPEVRD